MLTFVHVILLIITENYETFIQFHCRLIVIRSKVASTSNIYDSFDHGVFKSNK